MARPDARGGGLTPELIALRAELYEQDARAAATPGRALLAPDDIANSILGDIDRWRPLVSLYFSNDDMDWALAIIECESGGDPNARNRRSSARGLFQHLGKYWDERSRQAGWYGASIYDPEAKHRRCCMVVLYPGRAQALDLQGLIGSGRRRLGGLAVEREAALRNSRHHGWGRLPT